MIMTLMISIRFLEGPRRRFESEGHFIPQIAPRLIPQDKEESCICAVKGCIDVPL